MALTVQTGPADEPVSVPEFKLHAHIDGNSEDANLLAYLKSARSYVETYTRRQLIQATWTLYLDEFPTDEIAMPLPPLASVTHLKYYDTDGVQQTWAASNYREDTDSEPGRLARAYGVSWPGIQPIVNAIEIEFVAGYGTTPSSVPAGLRTAIMQLAAGWYRQREPVAFGGAPAKIPMHVESLLWPFRVLEFC
jgi:uncharacterized phiE125 gp8 family phage protein